MDPVQRFGAYAAAFEKAYASDDWSLLVPYFSEEAVYEILGEPPLGGRHQGRDAVLAYFKQAVDGFDRRFDTRSLELLEGPEVRDGRVWLRWRAVYTRAGAPDLAIEGEATAEFDGDRIARLEDRYAEGAAGPVVAYMAAHAAALHPVGGPVR